MGPHDRVAGRVEVVGVVGVGRRGALIGRVLLVIVVVCSSVVGGANGDQCREEEGRQYSCVEVTPCSRARGGLGGQPSRTSPAIMAFQFHAR